MEKLKKINVVGLLSEVLLEEVVDSSLEHESVVDGDVGDSLLQDASEEDDNRDLKLALLDTGRNKRCGGEVEVVLLTTLYQQG